MAKVNIKESINKVLRAPTAFVLVLVAIISLIGVILTNITNQKLAKIPIEATATAEAKLTEISGKSTRTSTLNPTKTFTVTPHPTITSTITPSTDWEELVEYDLYYSPCRPSYATIILGSENKFGLTQLTTEMLEDSVNNQTPENLGIVQVFMYDINFGFQVRSIVETNDWIKLENWVNFIVKPLPIEAPKFLHAYYTSSGCGGGEIKSFGSSVVKLETGTNEYHISTSCDDYEFLSLQPGELDIYEFNFSCRSPGVYQVLLEQNFILKGIPNQIRTGFPLIYCPESMIIWEVDPFGIDENTGKYQVHQNGIWGYRRYSWNGTEYVQP